MILYLGRLAPETTVESLRRHFRIPADQAWRLRLCKKTVGNGKVARYALYQPPSPRAGRRLLRTGKIRIEGREIGVREFLPRRTANERRRPHWRLLPWHGPERRLADRRLPAC